MPAGRHDASGRTPAARRACGRRSRGAPRGPPLCEVGEWLPFAPAEAPEPHAGGRHDAGRGAAARGELGRARPASEYPPSAARTVSRRAVRSRRASSFGSSGGSAGLVREPDRLMNGGCRSSVPDAVSRGARPRMLRLRDRRRHRPPQERSPAPTIAGPAASATSHPSGGTASAGVVTEQLAARAKAEAERREAQRQAKAPGRRSWIARSVGRLWWCRRELHDGQPGRRERKGQR